VAASTLPVDADAALVPMALIAVTEYV